MRWIMMSVQSQSQLLLCSITTLEGSFKWLKKRLIYSEMYLYKCNIWMICLVPVVVECLSFFLSSQGTCWSDQTESVSISLFSPAIAFPSNVSADMFTTENICTLNLTCCTWVSDCLWSWLFSLQTQTFWTISLVT